MLLAPLVPVLKRPAAGKRHAAAMAEDKAEVDDNNVDEDDGDVKSDPSEEMQEEPPSHEMEEELFSVKMLSMWMQWRRSRSRAGGREG